MEKQMIYAEILYSVKPEKNGPFTWAELQFIVKNNNIEMQNGDQIEIEYDSNANMYELHVTRLREETDEEAQKRIDRETMIKDNLKKRRRETYLELKKEFENE